MLGINEPTFAGKRATVGLHDLELELYDGMTFTIKLAPDHGTRFVFPFVLDEDHGFVPFSVQSINSRFVVNRGDNVKGRNFFITEYKYNTVENEINKNKVIQQINNGTFNYPEGNMFLNVDGYHITVIIQATFKPEDVYNNVFFTFSEQKRVELIEKAVKEKQREIEENFKKKEEELEKRANELVLEKLGNLVVSDDYDETRVYEDGEKTFPNGDIISASVVSVMKVNNIHTVSFEIEYSSVTQDPLLITNVSLMARKSNNDIYYPLSTSKFPSKSLNVAKRDTGLITTDVSNLMDLENRRLSILTNKGEVYVDW